jgi:hypothetical protein
MEGLCFGPGASHGKKPAVYWLIYPFVERPGSARDDSFSCCAIKSVSFFNQSMSQTASAVA